MSNIPNSDDLIQIEGARTRSPVSESLVQAMGGAINYLLSGLGNSQEFTASGSWTIPDNVNRVFVLACGGGGGGGQGNTAGLAGGQGGAGAAFMCVPKAVTPGDTVTITIGAGGVASSNGGNTTFAPSIGTSIVFKGGTKGKDANVVTPLIFRSGEAVGGLGSTGTGDAGQGNLFYDGGAASGTAGGGGAGLGGSGGVGNTNAVSTHYGAGGGAGQASGTPAVRAGKFGAGGYLLVAW